MTLLQDRFLDYYERCFPYSAIVFILLLDCSLLLNIYFGDLFANGHPFINMIFIAILFYYSILGFRLIQTSVKLKTNHPPVKKQTILDIEMTQIEEEQQRLTACTQKNMKTQLFQDVKHNFLIENPEPLEKINSYHYCA